MKFTTHNGYDTICILRTRPVGTLVDVSYDALYLAFGLHITIKSGKSDWEWQVEFEDGTVASIYNWKDGPNACRSEGFNR